MYKKVLTELVADLMYNDLKQLKEYEQAHEVSQEIEMYIEGKVSKEKDPRRIAAYRRVLEPILNDDAGRCMAMDVIKDRIESDYYKIRAKGMVVRYISNHRKETLST